MNWYVLYCRAVKIDQIKRILDQREEIHSAFIPQFEYWRRDIKGYAIKPMFPNYLFIKSELDQFDFDLIMNQMKEEKDGVIRQLKHDNATALSKDEIHFFEQLLDDDYIAKMSQAYLNDYNKAVVYEGPLQPFEKDIIKLDKHNQLAYLRFTFMDRNIKAGLKVQAKFDI